MGTTIRLLFLCALTGLAYTCSESQTYCWTRWLDRDNPSGSGDWETLRDFPQSQVCPKPIGIECQTTSGQPYQSTGTMTVRNSYLLIIFHILLHVAL